MSTSRLIFLIVIALNAIFAGANGQNPTAVAIYFGIIAWLTFKD